MDKVIDKYITFSTLQIISVYRSSEDVITFVSVKRKKDEFYVERQQQFTNWDDLVKSLKPLIPILIIVDGKGVLNKKLDLRDDIDVEWIKNLNYSEIYYTSFCSTDYEFISFCRRNIIDELYDDLVQKSYTVVDCYVGISAAFLLQTSLNMDVFYANITEIGFENDFPVSVRKVENVMAGLQYKIGDDVLTNFTLLPYSVALDFYSQTSYIRKSDFEKGNGLSLKYRKVFERLGITVLSFFFVALLISYLSIQYLIQKNAELTLVNNYAGKSFEEVKAMEQELDSKLKILVETGLSSKKYQSFYCYEITSSAPRAICLTELSVNPLQEKIKLTEKPNFEPKTIYIKGTTQSKFSLNDWIAVIKTMKWVKFLEIVSVKRDNKENTFFELKISIQDV